LAAGPFRTIIVTPSRSPSAVNRYLFKSAVTCALFANIS
jgi:hypothetical protein